LIRHRCRDFVKNYRLAEKLFYILTNLGKKILEFIAKNFSTISKDTYTPMDLASSNDW
jgi:hypothetical protein